MIFYHGGVSSPRLEKIRKKCPILFHGREWTPQKCLDEKHFIYDNGAFTDDFNPAEWVKGLQKMKEFNHSPDFVVLPDEFNDPGLTEFKSKKWVDVVRKFGYPYYYVAQKPGKPENEVNKAVDLGADGVFIGGADDWKKRNASEIVSLAHQNGLKAHIGMPNNYFWAYKTGADSMDSVSIARNEDYERIQDLHFQIKEQSTLGALT